MAPDPARQQELGQLLDQRRRDLRYSRAGLARLAGISYDTVRAVIRGANVPQDTTATGLETALKLQPGWIARYLGGATSEVEVTDDRPPLVLANQHDPLVMELWAGPLFRPLDPGMRLGMISFYLAGNTSQAQRSA